MPWEESSVLDLRIRFVQAAREGRASKAALCREYGISRKTGYKWLRRFEEAGHLSALVDRSRRPHTAPTRTRSDVEARVIAMRKERGWGARKLQVLLEREGIRLGESTINRILQRNGLVPAERQHQQAVKRFEYDEPNDLWQMDAKRPIVLSGGDRCFPLSILDDHSRFLIGLYALSALNLVQVRSCLIHSFRTMGLPKRILTDHGSPFWGTMSPYGLTQLSVMIMNQGVHMMHGAIRHPQTQGKVERLHGTLQQAFDHHGTPRALGACQRFFESFQREYNQERPHEALQMRTPADRYVPSSQPYACPAPQYIYPADLEVAQLNTVGCFDYQGERLFVCEALAKQHVGLRRIDNRLVVYFRELLIRDIDVATRHGRRVIPRV